MKINEIKLLGGVGKMKCNNGKQYHEQDRIYDSQGVATSIPANHGFHPYYQDNQVAVGDSKLRIRKLTPLECMKLMGFEKQDYDAMREIGMTDSAIYHMAGDSIVVPVLISIFSSLMEEDKHKLVVKDYIEKIVKN
jgi:DNA (cytosine-5)-methyltransferase 1